MLERFNKALTAKVLARLREANKALTKSAPPAVQGSGGSKIDLELAPD